MRRPSIKVATFAIFGLIAVAYGGLATSSLYGIRNMIRADDELSGRWLSVVAAVDDLTDAFRDERLAISKHMLSTNDEGMTKQEAKVSDAIAAQTASLNAIKSLPIDGTEQGLLDQYIEVKGDYDAGWERLRALSRQNRNQEALVVYDTELAPMGDKMNGFLNQIVSISDTGAARSKAESRQSLADFGTAVWVAVLLGGLAILAGILTILMTVIVPLGRITRSMLGLADGDTSTNIPYGGRQDEVGAMASAVEVFRRAAIANVELEADAARARQQAELDRVAAQEKAEAEAAERLRVATSGLASGLQRLASGELDFRIDEPFAPDFEPLRHDFNASVGKLGDTLSTISESISSIEGGAREISTGAHDLSKRTEQQAASLEETAAALDQITANVKSSTQRTDEARKVAGHATGAASKSTEVVGKAEEAMRRIEASSRQINNIIGVIDEIAFQTNLLALNAGVEAARAGEAGKGFAVIAPEVREIAQRAAAAAKEIKGLINTSSTEVVSGVTLVRDASEALKNIAEFIGEMNGHMGAIASSAQEQSVGLAEVNTAVNSMDQTTQQNAAMVEESTAASASLAMETQRLRELVGQFRLTGGQTAAVTSLRKTAALMAVPSAKPSDTDRSRSSRLTAAISRGSQSAVAVSAAVGEWQEF